MNAASGDTANESWVPLLALPNDTNQRSDDCNVGVRSHDGTRLGSLADDTLLTPSLHAAKHSSLNHLADWGGRYHSRNRETSLSMTPDRATGTEPTSPAENESSDLIAQLFDRVETLEAENERLHAVIDEVRDRHLEDCHALARENYELCDSQERLQERVTKAEEKDGFLLDDIIGLEDQLAGLENSSFSQGESKDADATSRRPELTPVERIAMLETKEVSINVTHPSSVLSLSSNTGKDGKRH
jgi:hypothetical protein